MSVWFHDFDLTALRGSEGVYCINEDGRPDAREGHHLSRGERLPKATTASRNCRLGETY